MKYVLAIFLALESILVHADPLVIDQPIIIFTQEEFAAHIAEVKKLYDEYKKLEAAKSCKKT